MITVESEKNIQNRVGDYRLFEFRGLSGDEKPTETYKSIKIANGSTFIEMDTEDVLFYDEESGDWVGGEGE